MRLTYYIEIPPWFWFHFSFSWKPSQLASLSLLPVLSLEAVWGKSSFLEHRFLITWIKGGSNCIRRKCAPTQFFPYHKASRTLQDNRSPIKNRQGSVLKEEEEWLLHHLHPSETPLHCLRLAEHSIHISGKVLWELQPKLSPAEFSLAIKTMSHKRIHMFLLYQKCKVSTGVHSDDTLGIRNQAFLNVCKGRGSLSSTGFWGRKQAACMSAELIAGGSAHVCAGSLHTQGNAWTYAFYPEPPLQWNHPCFILPS